MNFTKPQALNGKQLKDELKAQGITVETIEDNGIGVISFDVTKAKEDMAAEIVAAHIGVETQPTIAEKLASVGLSLEELRTALGSN